MQRDFALRHGSQAIFALRSFGCVAGSTSSCGCICDSGLREAPRADCAALSPAYREGKLIPGAKDATQGVEAVASP